jgi:hypothetical protein
MRIRLNELELATKGGVEIVPFKDFSYFHGQMGAGKSSIARLVDYCLGGKLDFTPALQSEFVAASLFLRVAQIDVVLHRERGSNQVRAQWKKDEDYYDVLIPTKAPDGEVLPDSSVEVLSDLFFYLSGWRPPKVRRSKIKDESDLVRLSIRDLVWYCYLDQDSMDSSFFNLDGDADRFKRLKSRDVLRFIIGFHQERVSELELQLEEVRIDRLKSLEGAKALGEALRTADVGTESEIQAHIGSLNDELSAIESELAIIRSDKEKKTAHVVDQLRHKAREIATELEAIEDAIDSVERVIGEDRSHLNELRVLSLKFRRTLSARAVLDGVEFSFCPRCTLPIPSREEAKCPVCGQGDVAAFMNETDFSVTEKDAQSRIDELDDSVKRRTEQLKNLRRKDAELQRAKGEVDFELNTSLAQYDSAYLSSSLNLEQRKAAIKQECKELEKLIVLPKAVVELQKKADTLASEESRLRRELKDAREEAEKDTRNLDRLEELFLDCLVRSKIPGFALTDSVSISSPDFLPQVTSPKSGEMILTSFSNLGSGGKKTLFKCCFAVAIHRLASEIDAHLPSFLIIDSPMKNISERSNREQFEGFHEMLYDLATSELSTTQFILIDKEFCGPDEEKSKKLQLYVRRMSPTDPGSPPLIRTYKGH